MTDLVDDDDRVKVVTVLGRTEYGTLVTEYDSFTWMFTYDPDFDDYETVSTAEIGTTIELELYEP